MEMVKVQNSSNLDEVGYSASEKTLVVRFKDGGTYQYKDVPSEKFDGLMEAESKGKYFAAEIKGKFETEKIATVTA